LDAPDEGEAGGLLSEGELGGGGEPRGGGGRKALRCQLRPPSRPQGRCTSPQGLRSGVCGAQQAAVLLLGAFEPPITPVF